MLIGTHTIYFPNWLMFSMVKALVIHQHVKCMPKIWCLRALLCFQVQVHALAMSQLSNNPFDGHSICLPTSDGKKAWPQRLEGPCSVSQPWSGWLRIRDRNLDTNFSQKPIVSLRRLLRMSFVQLAPGGDLSLFSFQLGCFYTWLKQDENWNYKLCILALYDFQRHPWTFLIPCCINVPINSNKTRQKPTKKKWDLFFFLVYQFGFFFFLASSKWCCP